MINKSKFCLLEDCRQADGGAAGGRLVAPDAHQGARRGQGHLCKGGVREGVRNTRDSKEGVSEVVNGITSK